MHIMHLWSIALEQGWNYGSSTGEWISAHFEPIGWPKITNVLSVPIDRRKSPLPLQITSLAQTHPLLSILPIALLSIISIHYFSQHFILVSHLMIHRSVVSVFVSNISFAWRYQFQFVIATSDVTRMVCKIGRQKWFQVDIFPFYKGYKSILKVLDSFYLKKLYLKSLFYLYLKNLKKS